MGNLCGGGEQKPAADPKANNSVDADLASRKNELQREVKLLLLGSGESGKSTIFKQLKKIHNVPYDEEIQHYKSSIYANILQTIKQLAESCIKHGIPFENEENKRKAENIIQLAESDTSLLLNANTAYTEEIAEDVKCLWNDKALQQMFEKRYDYHVFDGAAYFFANLDRLRPGPPGGPGYQPNFEDILRCRRKTTGIIELEFKYNNLTFKLFDVGGQRNERKKWIHCFESVTAVIFVASLSDYDQKCYEDDVTNRMMEAMDLFEQTINGNWFKNTPVVLLLNKTDIFKEKIQKTDLSVCFDDYTGGKSYESASKFIEQKFVETNKFDPHRIVVHYTCATETDAVKKVFDSVTEMIAKKALEGTSPN